MAATKIPQDHNNFVFRNAKINNQANAQIKAIFFDLDNTLIPTRAGDSKAIRKLTDVLETQFGLSKDDATLTTQSFLKAFRRCPDNSQTSLDSWRTYLWRESLPHRYKHLAEQVYPKWLKLRYRYLAVIPEYVQLLKRFHKAGYGLALITNGPSNAQWEKIRELNIRKLFDCILVSSDLPWEKPHQNIFFAACNFLNVKPQQCAMIGDKLETDIKGGYLANLGLTFWLPLSNNNHNLKGVEYPPHIILNNLLDLYKYFPKLNATTITSAGAVASGSVVAAGPSGVSPTAASIASTSKAATAITTANANSSAIAGISNAQNRRRCSQINFSTE